MSKRENWSFARSANDVIEPESTAIGVESLIEINPENAGEIGDGRCERQEQDYSPDGVRGDPPMRN